MEALTGTLGLRGGGMAEHSRCVATVAVRVGRRLRLGAVELHDLRYAAELHDLGKVGLPDAVLLKPGPLAADEWDLVRQHPALGEELVGVLPELAPAARFVRHHHERIDGGGYPDGLRGEAIPEASRVLAVADAFVAMAEDRPYRAALDPDEAAEELRAGSGTQFDARVVEALDMELEIERLARAVSTA